MTIINNKPRTFKIEGIKFTPSKGGTVVPTEKEKAVKENFFYKKLIELGTFSVKAETKSPAKTETKKAD